LGPKRRQLYVPGKTYLAISWLKVMYILVINEWNGTDNVMELRHWLNVWFNLRVETETVYENSAQILFLHKFYQCIPLGYTRFKKTLFRYVLHHFGQLACFSLWTTRTRLYSADNGYESLRWIWCLLLYYLSWNLFK